MEYWIYPIAISGGLLAGFVNTLAGNGSAITLTILMEVMGLPPNVANASNRVGIFGQSIVSTAVFHKADKIDWTASRKHILCAFLGAMLGLWLASKASDTHFRLVYTALMFVMLFVILANPKRWIQVDGTAKKPPRPLLWLGFFLLGVYGGFIQMGMGVLFLAFTVLVAKMDIIQSNALKIVVVGAYTGFVLLGFALLGMVHWKAGGLIAIGQIAGAWLCSKFATAHPKANIVAHRLLVVVVLFALAKSLWGMFS